jgi:hypothetical protein
MATLRTNAAAGPSTREAKSAVKAAAKPRRTNAKAQFASTHKDEIDAVVKTKLEGTPRTVNDGLYVRKFQQVAGDLFTQSAPTVKAESVAKAEERNAEIEAGPTAEDRKR